MDPTFELERYDAEKTFESFSDALTLLGLGLGLAPVTGRFPISARTEGTSMLLNWLTAAARLKTLGCWASIYYFLARTYASILSVTFQTPAIISCSSFCLASCAIAKARSLMSGICGGESDYFEIKD
jgi:hypothetical protein